MERNKGNVYEVAYGENIYASEVSNLKTVGALCKKHPGHNQFISVKEFELSHLPPKYQDEDVMKWIQRMAGLTVLIRTKFISNARPDRFPGSEQRGKIWCLTGTGFCTGVDKCGNSSNFDQSSKSGGLKVSEKNDHFCKCSYCKQSGHPKSFWWEVSIRTAAHVVFDDIEAANTDVVFFYDDMDSETITVHGHRVSHINLEHDFSQLVCLIHDSDEAQTLVSKIGRHMHQNVNGDQWGLERDSSGLDKLCVIISHPHGSTKQISIGKHVKHICRDTGVMDVVYNTPTCPGSSGACITWAWGTGKTQRLPRSRSENDSNGRTARLVDSTPSVGFD